MLAPLALTATWVAGEDSIEAPRAHDFLDFTGDGKPDDLSALVPDPAMTRGAGGAGAIVATASERARRPHGRSGGPAPPGSHREFTAVTGHWSIVSDSIDGIVNGVRHY